MLPLNRLLLALAVFAGSALAVHAQQQDWPAATSETKPWTRWWWHGSAVNKQEITRELESFAQAGIGGVEITPIYGVKGQEALAQNFLSDEWLDLVKHACLEAQRLGMQVDIVPGTGWRLGREDIPENERAVELELHKTGEGKQTRYDVTFELSGERVKRPAPGGSGYTIDMLDRNAVANYIDHFNQTFFAKISPDLVRAVFHDSWEYETNWSHDFRAELDHRHRLNTPEAYAIFDRKNDTQSADSIERWRYDYRLTLDELLLENFSDTWNQKTHAYGLITRNQAHGSIANLLDVYAKTDIPETEIFGDSEDFLMHKFASSAAHVTKKRLVSSESYTWLSEHWTSNLAKLKRATDYLLLCGVNHMFFHGTAYSPDDAAWPGWVFYASTQINDRNPLWNHLPALTAYITRSQSVLQSGTPYSDIYLYSPIADPYSQAPGDKLRQNIDGRNWFKGTGLETTSQQLWDGGVHFDFISDRQIQALAHSVESTPTIVLPVFKRIPVKTVAALIQLANDGVTVISLQDPSGWQVPGYENVEQRQAQLEALVKNALLNGQIKTGTIDDVLALAPDTWQTEDGFRCIRRIQRDGTHSYFIVNRSEETNTVTLPLATTETTCLRLDPWTGQTGSVTLGANNTLKLTLTPFESTIIHTGKTTSPAFPETPTTLTATTIKLNTPWTLTFKKGGPQLPEPITLQKLVPITQLGDPRLDSFAGLLAYQNTFTLTQLQAAESLTLDLGALSSSAQVFINDQLIGTAIRAPYILSIPASALNPGKNHLRIEVATLADNRIRHLDRTGTAWRIFEDINFVNIDYRPFDASNWPITPYGLTGPVTLTTTP